MPILISATSARPIGIFARSTAPRVRGGHGAGRPEAAEGIDDLMHMPGRCHPHKASTTVAVSRSSRMSDGAWCLDRRRKERRTDEIEEETAALITEIIDYHGG